MLPAYLSYFLGLEGDDAGGAPGRRRRGACGSRWRCRPGSWRCSRSAGALVELTSLPVYENVPWISVVIGVALLVLGVAMLCRVRAQRSRCPGSTGAAGTGRSARCSCSASRTPSPRSAAPCRCSSGRWPGPSAASRWWTGSSVRPLRAGHDAGAGGPHRCHRPGPHVDRPAGAPRPALHVRVAGGLVALAGAYVACYGWLELRTPGPGRASCRRRRSPTG